ncbi:efflux RND transporter periplasmic adaptor subunit [Verrucomicrobia bacterium]|jgi:HlyD family secretion protein|nr:efflux RND transporter periplasmic adaptor subunit [Verrucomicrobiota bacterium]MDA7510887.1 efflux RND transporter periplasmic adaptor subunit [Verrucomicrobiota bacterium]MDA7866984.1 efflux RND transporter periplasmic adaptor subunit [Verrucomicrobiota bacterium]
MAAKKSKKRRKFIIFTVILIVLGGLSAAAVMRKKEVTLSIETETAALRDVTEVVVSDGRIHPVLKVTISPEVSGEIINLPVTEGQDVKKGDLLLEIRPDLYKAAVAQSTASYKSALAGLDSAKANLKNAEFEYSRVEKLFNDDLESDSVFQRAQTTLEVSRASHESSTHQVAMSKASLDRTLEDLAKTSLRSPLDGTITLLNSELGERVLGTVQNMGTEIMIISDLNAMEARVDIGEIDIVLVEIGQKARLEVDAFRDQEFSGVVSEIANSARTSGAGSQQEATKFEVRILINEKEAFRPGMSVTADIETRSRKDVVTVPFQSVTTRMPPKDSEAEKKSDVKETPTKMSKEDRKKANKPIEVVFVVEEGKAKMVPVERGISDDNYFEITSGVEAGQSIVSGSYKAIAEDLEDGMKVKLNSGDTNLDDSKEDEKP